jgi:hypothetical protein
VILVQLTYTITMQTVTKKRFTMACSKTNSMTREEVLAAIRNISESAYFVWDGIDEDERPLTKEELLAGIAAMEAQRGRRESLFLRKIFPGSCSKNQQKSRDH